MTPVIRVRAARTLDPYSLELTALDWSGASRARLDGAVISPQSTSEVRPDGRVTVRTFYQLMVPGVLAEDITADDRFEWDGRSWSVAGDVLSYAHQFTGWSAGLVVNVVEVSG